MRQCLSRCLLPVRADDRTDCLFPLYMIALPVAVYPNSGEIYDPVTKTWHGDFVSGRYEQWALEWMESGASAVGGCCRTVAKHIEEVSHAREKFLNR